MINEDNLVFETKRLVVRIATSEDASLFFNLWTNPDVMSFVGFPQGLPISIEEIADKLLDQKSTPFGQLLVVVLKNSGESIGECKLHPPNEKGLAETDVKLLSPFWGNKFGVEIKQGLLAYLFKHTDCSIVQATPNVKNVASIKMQEAVGGKRVGEAIFEFSDNMKDYTMPVHHFIYHVYREDWQQAPEQER